MFMPIKSSHRAEIPYRSSHSYHKTFYEPKIPVACPSFPKHRQRLKGFELWLRQSHIGATLPDHGEQEIQPRP